jgi:hypothetical protein
VTRPARVVLLGLDGFPIDALSPTETPHLWALGHRAGQAPPRGTASLPSSTYPGFASLLTGERLERHGVWCTGAGREPPRWAGTQQVRTPTLFDRCRASGRHSAAILGDHLLHAVLRTESLEVRWPAGPAVPVGVDKDAHGYATNRSVVPQLLRAVDDSSLDFVFGQLNETDTLGHELGPMHPTTLACCSATDAMVGAVLEGLQPDWERTLVIVVSDHDMAPGVELEPVDLMADPRVSAIADVVWLDGGTALFRVRPDVRSWTARTAVRASDGVACVDEKVPGVLVAGVADGHHFRSDRPLSAGFHGGPSTRRTLALVGGGHPMAAQLSAGLVASQPHLRDWAAPIAQALELDDVEGHQR